MKLESLGTWDAYLHLERRVNQPKYSIHAQYSEAEPPYHPRLGNETINIPYSWSKEAILKTAHPHKDLLALMMNNGMRLFTHPQFSTPPFDGSITATPTASTRTVFTQEKNIPYFIKLHFPKRISRFNRRLRPSSIEHSLAISADLEEALETAPASFAYLPESIGIYLPCEQGYGCIIRETTPHPTVSEKRTLIPFFSLYSQDPTDPDTKPLLIQLIEKAQEKPLNYFINNIITPFLANWIWCAQTRGLLLESHCQNTLLEINDQYKPTRIVYRDFQSIMVDPEPRLKNNLPTYFKKHIIGGKEDPFSREQEYSLVYDHFVAAYVFPYFTSCLQEHAGIPEQETREAIKKTFQKLLPNQEHTFPKTVFTLTDRLLENNQIEVKNTHELPEYR